MYPRDSMSALSLTRTDEYSGDWSPTGDRFGAANPARSVTPDLPTDTLALLRQTVLRGRPSADDEVEDALLRMKDLVEHALHESRQRQTTAGMLISRYPIEDWRGVAGRLLRSSRREFVLAASGVSECTDEQLEMAREIVELLLVRGVGVRNLFSPGAMSRHPVQRYAEAVSRRGAEVRIVGQALQDTIIVDGRVAVVWGRIGPTGEECLLMRGSPVLTSMYRLFGVAWDAANDLSVHTTWFCEDDIDEVTLSVMRQLGAGCKDETAARKLGMSVRTYRRHVAEIMRRLGATTRFQAGLRAMQLGLVVRP
jgi:DNA-binding CsgD family transcriptional regulator